MAAAPSRDALFQVTLGSVQRGAECNHHRGAEAAGFDMQKSKDMTPAAENGRSISSPNTLCLSPFVSHLVCIQLKVEVHAERAAMQLHGFPQLVRRFLLFEACTGGASTDLRGRASCGSRARKRSCSCLRSSWSGRKSASALLTSDSRLLTAATGASSIQARDPPARPHQLCMSSPHFPPSRVACLGLVSSLIVSLRAIDCLPQPSLAQPDINDLM